jgi:hypothetical protein
VSDRRASTKRSAKNVAKWICRLAFPVLYLSFFFIVPREWMGWFFIATMVSIPLFYYSAYL